MEIKAPTMTLANSSPLATRTPLTLSLSKGGLPLNPQPNEAKLAQKAGSDFEALLVARMLKTARAAKLGDDLLGNNDQIRDLVDETRARAVTAAAPLGLAQLLAREAKR